MTNGDSFLSRRNLFGGSAYLDIGDASSPIDTSHETVAVVRRFPYVCGYDLHETIDPATKAPADVLKPLITIFKLSTAVSKIVNSNLLRSLKSCQRLVRPCVEESSLSFFEAAQTSSCRGGWVLLPRRYYCLFLLAARVGGRRHNHSSHTIRCFSAGVDDIL
jgi:hypothetical protein